MNAELTEATAAQILDAHERAQRLAAECRENMAAAIEAGNEAGLHLCGAASQYRGKFLQWLAQHLPDLHPEQAKRYMSLHQTRQGRGELAIDHRQLLLIGVIDPQDDAPQERPAKPIQDASFVRYAGAINGWFSKATETRPLAEWDRQELEVAAMTLEPVGRILDEIHGLIRS
jgi:hypothetical protein